MQRWQFHRKNNTMQVALFMCIRSGSNILLRLCSPNIRRILSFPSRSISKEKLKQLPAIRLNGSCITFEHIL